MLLLYYFYLAVQVGLCIMRIAVVKCWRAHQFWIFCFRSRQDVSSEQQLVDVCEWWGWWYRTICRVHCQEHSTLSHEKWFATCPLKRLTACTNLSNNMSKIWSLKIDIRLPFHFENNHMGHLFYQVNKCLQVSHLTFSDKPAAVLWLLLSNDVCCGAQSMQELSSLVLLMN